MFELNESGFDRVLRTVVGLVLLWAGLLLLGGVTGAWLGVVVAVVGAFALFTGLSGFCVVYRIFHVTTLSHHGPMGAA